MIVFRKLQLKQHYCRICQKRSVDNFMHHCRFFLNNAIAQYLGDNGDNKSYNYLEKQEIIFNRRFENSIVGYELRTEDNPQQMGSPKIQVAYYPSKKCVLGMEGMSV